MEESLINTFRNKDNEYRRMFLGGAEHDVQIISYEDSFYSAESMGGTGRIPGKYGQEWLYGIFCQMLGVGRSSIQCGG